MEDTIVKVLLNFGPFAVLLFYVMREFKNMINRIMDENEKREERLYSCLENLSSEYKCLSADVGEIKSDVKDLKEKIA